MKLKSKNLYTLLRFQNMDNSWIDTEDYIYDSWKDEQVMKSFEHFYVSFYIMNRLEEEYDILNVILGEILFNHIINSIETLDNAFVRVPEFKRPSDYNIRVDDIVRIESTRISLDDVDMYEEGYL